MVSVKNTQLFLRELPCLANVCNCIFYRSTLVIRGKGAHDKGARHEISEYRSTTVSVLTLAKGVEAAGWRCLPRTYIYEG